MQSSLLFNHIAKAISQIVSYLFHPIFITGYALLIFTAGSPVLLHSTGTGGFSKELFYFSVISLTILFPLVAIFMLKAMGIISSLEMPDKGERVIPLLATTIFYLWLYINIRNNFYVPVGFTTFTLGCLISLFLAFFINNFTKISLHAIGISGLLSAALLFRFSGGVDLLFFNQLSFFPFVIHIDMLLCLLIVMAGLVGTSRLYRKAHTEIQLYGGYLIGFVSQYFAFAAWAT
jgi:hypothetical protein